MWISKGDQEKIIWNFHGPWFLVSEIPIRATQFCGISRGKDLFSLEFFKKSMSSAPPHVWIFSGIAH